MTNYLVCHSRKGGVGKTTLAYELAYLLDAVLVDLEHDGGSASLTWGYDSDLRVRIPILDALESNRTPKPLTGFRKPDLVPGHALLDQRGIDADTMAEALLKWGAEWGKPWVVVDTHPGASPITNGALSIANVVVVPTPLKKKEITATEKLVSEMADYPLVIVPNMVPQSPSVKFIKQLAEIIEGTPVQVAQPVPLIKDLGDRERRMAVTAEPRPSKANMPLVQAIRGVAEFVKEYVSD